VIFRDFLAITRKFFGNVEVKTDDELENMPDTAWLSGRGKRTPDLNMRKFPRAARYTQNELAEKLGILRNHVSAMETRSVLSRRLWP